MAGCVDGCLDFLGGRVGGEGEEGAEGEVLDYGEFGEDFCVVHFDHSLFAGVSIKFE